MQSELHDYKSAMKDTVTIVMYSYFHKILIYYFFSGVWPPMVNCTGVRAQSLQLKDLQCPHNMGEEQQHPYIRNHCESKLK